MAIESCPYNISCNKSVTCIVVVLLICMPLTGCASTRYYPMADDGEPAVFLSASLEEEPTDSSEPVQSRGERVRGRLKVALDGFRVAAGNTVILGGKTFLFSLATLTAPFGADRFVTPQEFDDRIEIMHPF